MKLEALDHPKTLDLCAQLHVEIPTAIGHLELLWAWTGKKAPQGNVGKWPDGAIAVACFWRGEPAKFIDGLLAAGLLDRHPEHRLVVHDWHDHAPNWVKAKLSKAKQEFMTRRDVRAGVSAGISGSVSDDADDDTPTDAPTDTRSDTATDTSSSRARVLPSEVKGSEGKTSSASRVRADRTRVSDQSTKGETGTNRDPAADMTACGAMAIELRKFGIQVNSIHPILVAWVQDGFTVDQVMSAAAQARDTLGDDQVIRPKYVDTILRAPPKRARSNGSSTTPSAPRRLTPIEIIEKAILDGRSDEEIYALPELELWPTVRDDTRNMRQEIAASA